MKLNRLLVIIVLLICKTISADAQNIIPDTLREGKLTYLKERKTIWKMGTEKLTGKSYTDSYPNLHGYLESTIKPIFYIVFSEKRVKELLPLTMSFNIFYDAIDNKIIRITYHWSGNGKFPLKLSELEALEMNLKSQPNLIPKTNPTKNISNTPAVIWIPLKFKEMYN